jgi:hypothetical protein
VAVIAAAASMLVAGCGSAASDAPTGGSVESFAAKLRQDYDADYEPLATPRQAVEQSDLIVRGTVEEVFDGIAITYPDAGESKRGQGRYVTLRVSVADVVSGAGDSVRDGQVFVQVPKSRSVPTKDIAAANPKADAVLILEDITNWTPVPGATVARPAEQPAKTPIFFAFSDGLWLQDSQTEAPVGTIAEVDQLGPAWQTPGSLDELVQVIESAR